MVDTGWNTDEAFGSLEAQLGELGLSFGDITQIVVTHVHSDHYGLAGRIKQVSPAKLAFHHWEKALIESRYIHFTELQEKMGQLLHSHGVPPVSLHELQTASQAVLPFVTVAWPDQVLYGGERFSLDPFQLQVLWTPGHSPGHVCLYEEKKRLLFAGDHILPIITPNVSYHLQSGSNPLSTYIHSLQQLVKLPVELVLPAHEHVFQGLSQRVEELVQHHEERKAAILEIIKSEPQTAYTISAQIPWNVPESWEGLDPLHKRIAVTETLAHLELLWMEGEVERLSKDDIILYRMVR